MVGDTKYADLREENCWCPAAGESTAPIAYVPIAQNPSPYAWAPIIVRSSGSSVGVSGAIAQRIGRFHPGIAIQIVEMKTQVRERLIGERMIAWLAGIFGILAMALVTVGLYGLIAYLAVSRRREIGIRLSLGSTRTQIVALLLRDNLLFLGAGLAIGLPLAVVAMRGTGTLLFGLSPTSARGMVEAISLLAAAGMVAAAVPAWRAARIRLGDALRCE